MPPEHVAREGAFLRISQFNVSPSFTLELLERLARVFKDYCGVLTEESIRKNFILIYELLDEMLVRLRRGVLAVFGFNLQCYMFRNIPSGVCYEHA